MRSDRNSEFNNLQAGDWNWTQRFKIGAENKELLPRKEGKS